MMISEKQTKKIVKEIHNRIMRDYHNSFDYDGYGDYHEQPVFDHQRFEASLTDTLTLAVMLILWKVDDS